jgi:microcin C transport system permease protein
VTDYRDPFIADEIAANGWMLWPPIRYSYAPSTTRCRRPRPAALLAADGEGSRCARYPRRASPTRTAAIGNWNWLGTDDQGATCWRG